MRTDRLVPIVVFVALAVGMRQGDLAVTFTPVAETLSVRPGTSARVALIVKTPETWHIQSNTPRDPSLIPMGLTFDPPQGVSVAGLAFPKPVDIRVAGYDDPLSVFEGEFAVGVTLTVGNGAAPGTITLPARVRYQACDEKQCFNPKTVVVHWTINVAPSGPMVRQRADVFDRIDWTRAQAPASAAPAAASTASAPTLSRTDALAEFDKFELLGAETDGYVSAATFLEFIKNAEAGIKRKGLLEGRGPLAVVALVFLGGLALNLTPCVLPMIPINLAIIGAGARSGSKRGRGFALGLVYGAAMAFVYGVLGLVVVLTAGTFGTINASPWFNIGIAILFVFLGLAMFDVVSLDFSRYSSGIRFDQKSRGTFLLAFSMGAVAALLAGACVAPVVVQVVVLASNLYAQGASIALALPFVLGLGMAVPWPIAGAGMAAMPKPGPWMERVKQVMGVFILATAVYYGYVAYEILSSRWVDPASVQASVDAQLKAGWQPSLVAGLTQAERENKRVIVDFWATWCKNCLVMDKTTLEDGAVKAALNDYVRIKFQAEDLDASPAKELMQRLGAKGLPAYAILGPRKAGGVAR